MKRWHVTLVLVLMLGAAADLAALETIRGVLRLQSEFQCINGCGTYYMEPDPTFQFTLLKGDFRRYIDQHVEITGFRDNCSGCSVLIPSVPVIVLPPLSVADEEPVLVPRDVRLMQNYPNPFNPSTMIEYALPARSSVRLAIYDLNGQQVELLVDAEEPPGVYRKSWSSRDLAAGVYLCRLRVTNASRNTSITRSMILVR